MTPRKFPNQESKILNQGPIIGHKNSRPALHVGARPFLSWNESGRLRRQAGRSLPNTRWQPDSKVLFIAQAGGAASHQAKLCRSRAAALQQRAEAMISLR
jgi:hypothetical protein